MLRKAVLSEHFDGDAICVTFAQSRRDGPHSVLATPDFDARAGRLRSVLNKKT